MSSASLDPDSLALLSSLSRHVKHDDVKLEIILSEMLAELYKLKEHVQQRRLMVQKNK